MLPIFQGKRKIKIVSCQSVQEKTLYLFDFDHPWFSIMSTASANPPKIHRIKSVEAKATTTCKRTPQKPSPSSKKSPASATPTFNRRTKPSG